MSIPRFLRALVSTRLTSAEWLSIISAVLTIVVSFTALTKVPHDSAGVVLATFVCLLLSVCLFFIVVEEFRWHRKARYAEALQLIHDAYHEIRDASWALINNESDVFVRGHLQTSLKSFAAAFSLIAGAACRSCVKDLVCVDAIATRKDEGFVIQDLCRDEVLPGSPGASGPDKLTDNSDFLSLWTDPRQRWFTSNDLLDELNRGYRNSHWSPEMVAKRKIDYLSAFVWPIRKTLPPSGPPGTTATCTQDLLGFLCVDSRSRGIFLERYDFHLGAAYADTLYSFIKSWRHHSATRASPEELGKAGYKENG